MQENTDQKNSEYEHFSLMFAPLYNNITPLSSNYASF